MIILRVWAFKIKNKISLKLILTNLLFFLYFEGLNTPADEVGSTKAKHKSAPQQHPNIHDWSKERIKVWIETLEIGCKNLETFIFPIYSFTICKNFTS